MNMALICERTVIQIEEKPAVFPVAAPMCWVPAKNPLIRTGWLYDPKSKEFTRPAGPELVGFRAAMLDNVDRIAGLARAEFVTPAQASIYAAKRRELESWYSQSPDAINISDYPWATARAARLARTDALQVTRTQVSDVMIEWRARVKLCDVAQIAIEDVREGAKDAIRSAETTEEIKAIIRDARGRLGLS